MDESLIREQEAQLQKTGRYYKHICFMAVPVLCMACFLYGVRPLLLCGIAVLTGNLCDRLVSLLRRRVYQGSDFSNESFALVIALLMPVTVDIYVLIAAVLAGVLIGKEIFGGYGSYPFNPAAVGYVVAAVSWPEQVFRYPQPYTSIPLWDASMVPVSSAIEDTLRSGGMLNIRSLALGLGEYAAPMGTGAALVILACGLFLWTQKDAHMSASISFLVTCAVIAFFFPRQAGLADSAVLANILPRLQCVRDELLTGAILFSAVFLLNEPYTCVHHRMGRVLYGVLVGVVSMGFRYYGVYETGVCFALLVVNSVSAWIDRTEAKLYHLTHLQADAGKGAAQ
ncbi:MAG: RnfABCDGE type electron transport complex subunit D [Faecalibacterium prausnitzii]